MAGLLNIAFWNVQNLLEPADARRLGRGPRTARERNAKLDRLADVINGFFNDRGPDLIALAEIGGRQLFDDLLRRLKHKPNSGFLNVWEDRRSGHTGLGIIGRVPRIAGLKTLDTWRPVMNARPRILLVECAIGGISRPVTVVINHWKSRMLNSLPNGLTDSDDRNMGAAWLGNRLKLGGLSECVVMIGDLNCEPTESPLNNTILKGVRHTSAAIYERQAVTVLYNTAWRFWIEPDPWKYKRKNYRASRPKTTFGATGAYVIFDQLLVSKDALKGKPLSLQESKIKYHPDARIFEHGKNSGHVRPIPWAAKAGGYVGASDHLPLLATFKIH